MSQDILIWSQVVPAVFSAAAALFSLEIARRVFAFQKYQKERDEVLTILKGLPAGLPHPSELKWSSWNWSPRAENGNVVFQEIYVPLIKALRRDPLSQLAENLEKLIVRDFFDLWNKQKAAGGDPTEEPMCDGEKQLWDAYEARRKELREGLLRLIT